MSTSKSDLAIAQINRRHRFRKLFGQGMNTQQIAKFCEASEAEVYNQLHYHKEFRRSRGHK